jgi:sphingolipid 4-desaturase/C4-monooxygenase
LAVVVAKVTMAWYAQVSWTRAIVLGITLAPFLDGMILVLMHELSHNRMFSVRIDRLVSMGVNILMLAPISEVFRQHHRAHHLSLGDAQNDVDAPSPWEIEFVGNGPFKKAIWLFFNMLFLPIRSLTKLEVKWCKWVVLNFVTSIGFTLIILFTDLKLFFFFGLSLMFSQGLHPVNARQLQRHFWDGSEEKAINKQGHSSHTFSYYGKIYNSLYLNVGYHNEHHDFAQVPWTRLPELKAMVGDEWYPDDSKQAYASRGFSDLINFIFNRKVSI